MDANLQELFSKALNSGLDRNAVQQIVKVNSKVRPQLLKKPWSTKYVSFIIGLIAVLFVAGAPKWAFRNPINYLDSYFNEIIYDHESSCLVSNGAISIELTRPLSKCSMCRGLAQVPVVHNMTKEYFIKHHAYSGVPVLVKKGTGNWTALRIFSYKYFKLLYKKTKSLDDFDDMQCQFFGYKTNLRSLKHVFRMSKARAQLQKDQWYIGWSNCIPKVQNILRKHYNRPAFLPDDSESSSLDWIFMGGSGNGALMHIDSVNRPSWQAMIKGKKTWYLEPPPECELECPKGLSATMEPGDILVVDTNRWYHSTYIHPGAPGEHSITIGSEYD